METEKQSMVASFMEIAVCDSAETARQFLQATSWRLEEAIQLFFVGNEGSEVASSSLPKAPEKAPLLDSESSVELNNDTINENVRPPLPVKREALYDDAFLYRGQGLGHPTHQPNTLIAFRNFEEEAKHSGVWDSEQSTYSTADTPRDNLASLYRPPFALMYHGTFEQAKLEAARQGKWLIINLQSTKEFSSHMLNRDTWSNEAVAQTIRTGFIFWQIYDDTDEGRKVCTYYNLVTMPIVLVLDPITGQKMRAWSGMIEPQRLLEDLLPYMDKGPNDHHPPLPHKRPRESYQNYKTSLPKNFPEVPEGVDDLRQDLNECFNLLDKGLLNEETRPCEAPAIIPAGHVEESCEEFPPTQGGVSQRSHHSHGEGSKGVHRKTPVYGGRTKGSIASTMFSIEEPARPTSFNATAWALHNKAEWDDLALRYLKLTIETMKRQMKASLVKYGGRDDMIPPRIDKLRRRLVELHMDTSQLKAFGETWSVLMARYVKCTQNSEDADAISERQLHRDKLLEKQARAKKIQAEAVRAVDVAVNKVVELSKSIQDLNEQEARLEEELSTIRKKRDSQVTELATVQDEVILQEPVLQAANEDCDMIDQELLLVDQNAAGDRDVLALRDLATKEVIADIEESVAGFLEADWLAALLAL